ncbi:MAG: hypothetical protein K2Y22_04365 [Candidatus Obscuribacterales bacterium]|nr:hypothetical protein [Candidatus Obscuribacterales bacterium]
MNDVDINNKIAEHVMKWQLTGNNTWTNQHGGVRVTDGSNNDGHRQFTPATSINDAMSAVKILLRRHHNQEWKFWSAANHHAVGVIKYVCGLKRNGIGIAVASDDSYSIAICDVLLQVSDIRMRGYAR